MEFSDEIKEKAEEARGPFDRKVAATMAITAAVLALVSVLGHVLTTDELLAEEKAADYWAYYQANNIRRYNSAVTRDLLSLLGEGKPGVDQALKHYADDTGKFQKTMQEVQQKARESERESAIAGQRARRLHTGEIFLEVGIVLGSLAILTKRRAFWLTNIAALIAGGVIALTALLAAG